MLSTSIRFSQREGPVDFEPCGEFHPQAEGAVHLTEERLYVTSAGTERLRDPSLAPKIKD